MKKIIYIILGIFLFSCDDFVDETPKGNLIPTSIDDLGYLMYSMPDNDMTAGFFNGTTIQFYMSDDVYYKHGDWIRENIKNAYLYKDVFFANNDKDMRFSSLYKAIYISNYVIENIDHAPESKEKFFERNIVKGNAYFHRAFNHFMLAIAYSSLYHNNDSELSIPYVTKSSTSQTYKRNTIKEVYTYILSDLEVASKYLGEHVDFKNPSQVSLNALYSKINFFMGKYDLAISYAQNVLQKKSVIDDYTNWSSMGYPYRNTLLNDPDLIYYKAMSGGQMIDLKPSAELLAEFGIYDLTTDKLGECKDYRKHLLTFQSWTSCYAFNFTIPKNGGLSTSETILNLVESYLRLEIPNAEKAKEWLNKFLPMRYSQVPEISTLNNKDLLDFVKSERRKEFCTRGTRFFDLKRWKTFHNEEINIIHTVNEESVTLNSNSNKWNIPFPKEVKYN